MQRGDLSNAQAPRVLMQWEHMLAVPRPVAGRRWWSRVKADPYDVDAMMPHPHVLKVAWDYSSRHGVRVDAWTQWPAEKLPDIRQWLRDWSVPCHSAISCSHEELEARLMVMPFVRAVVHAGSGRPLAFRGRGSYFDAADNVTNI